MSRPEEYGKRFANIEFERRDGALQLRCQGIAVKATCSRMGDTI